MAVEESIAAPPSRPLPPGAPRAGIVHVRHRHTERYTVVGNHLAQHRELSACAIGLGVYLQSLPDGAPVSAKALTLRFREGETVIRRALNELERAGYVERRRVALGRGRFATRTIGYDRPRHVRPEGPARSEQPTPEAHDAPTPEAPAPAEPETVAAAAAGVQGRPDRTASTTLRSVTPLLKTAVAPSGDVPASTTSPESAGASVRSVPPPAGPPAVPPGPGADLLVRLRLADPRLLLSARDVAGLVPAVDRWFARGATPDQVAWSLTSGLPPAAVPIHHPARFVAHRLSEHLPPPLPAAPPRPGPPPPLVTCDGCERAFRSHDTSALCGSCTTDEPVAPAERPAPGG